MVSRTFLLALTSLPVAVVLGAAQPAQAILTYNIYESSSNVVVQASGRLNLSGAISLGQGSCPYNGVIVAFNAFLCTGSSTTSPIYRISGPTSFSGSAVKLGANSVSGIFTFLSGTELRLYLDPAYTSGDQILSSATYNSATLAEFGYTTPGPIGTWTLNGTSETINVVIGPPSTVVPGPLPLLGAGAAFGFSRRLRRRVSLSRSISHSATSIRA